MKIIYSNKNNYDLRTDLPYELPGLLIRLSSNLRTAREILVKIECSILLSNKSIECLGIFWVSLVASPF